jgi:hypothetical protein
MDAASFTISWWMWCLAAVALAAGSAGLTALGLAVVSAYGGEYHSLNRRQRWMGRWVYRGSLLGAVACGVLAALGLALGLYELYLLLAG